MGTREMTMIIAVWLTQISTGNIPPLVALYLGTEMTQSYLLWTNSVTVIIRMGQPV